MTTWTSQTAPEMPAIGPMGWLRVILRGSVLGAITFGCLGLLLLVRLVEKPLFGSRRPVTPYITQFVCKSAFVVLGMRHKTTGKPMSGAGAYVANHSSWLDIFALNAPKRIYFVSKAEVAGWPGIGWLARATGTVFIRRKAGDAKTQKTVFEDRLAAGHQLMFFPEGTSTDGLRVLPFKSTLFAAFFTDHLPDELTIQPVTVVYTAPEGEQPRFYGWWGDMEFGPHLLHTLAAPRQGGVEIIYHQPLKVAEFTNRKDLAAAAGAAVRAGLKARLPAELYNLG